MTRQGLMYRQRARLEWALRYLVSLGGGTVVEGAEGSDAA
jgi:hypothetical protein